MESPTLSDVENSPEEPERRPNNCMNSATLFHKCAMEVSNPLNGKGKISCICHKNPTTNSITTISTVACDVEEPEDLSDAYERRIWECAMKPFILGAKSQRETAVLMISWAKELDDLHTEEEVNGLESVFAGLFNYTVIKRQITEDKPPAIQLSKYLSDFVYTYDNESTLLIVYYAGHGIPKTPGGLHFAGNRQPHKELSNRNAAAWHDVEHIIRDAEGDALLIFDCCYAGNLTLRDVRLSRPTRSFEYIAACGGRDETSFPGPESFTSAMIWALKDLVKNQKKFSTLDLQTKIMTEAPFFPRKQSVLLMERDTSCDQRLVLTPLLSQMNGISAISAQDLDELPQNSLDLRFWYYRRPDNVELENLANRLKRLIKEQNIEACCVSWLGRKSNHGLVHLNGNAESSNSLWIPQYSGSNMSQSNCSDYQTETSNPMRRETKNVIDITANEHRKVTTEDWGLAEGYKLINRGSWSILRQIFGGVRTRAFSISMCLAVSLCAWYNFSYSSFPFNIWRGSIL